jgi:hypothetical protein
MTSSLVELESKWTPKPCDLCGNTDNFRRLGDRVLKIPRRRTLYIFRHVDVTCERCGFSFGRQVPEEAFLHDYYRDAPGLESDHASIQQDYDEVARLEPLKRHLKEGANILEMGAGDGAFCRFLETHGYRASGIDPLARADRNVVRDGFVGGEGADADPEVADAVVSYFVLEHVPFPRTWLRRIRAHMKPNAILVIEVPNVETNPLEGYANEHFLEFTPGHLGQLMESEGFDALSIGTEPACRFYGMVYVGQVSATRFPEKSSPEARDPDRASGHVADAVTRYEDVLAVRQQQEELVKGTASRIVDILNSQESKTPRVYFWGANDLSIDIVNRLRTLRDVDPEIVDSARSKIGTHHWGFSRPVLAPDFSRQDDHHRVFVLCSRVWNDQIAVQIESMGLEGITVLDSTSWPNRL